MKTEIHHSDYYGDVVYRLIGVIDHKKGGVDAYCKWAVKYHPRVYFMGFSCKPLPDHRTEYWVPAREDNKGWVVPDHLKKYYRKGKLPIAFTEHQINKWLEKSKFLMEE